VVAFVGWVGVAAAVVGGLVLAIYLFWPWRED
jgi:hypothetical protein